MFLYIWQERYNALKHQNEHNKKEFECSKETGNQKFLEKTLSEALDSFDNIFCRRCLVIVNTEYLFDMKLFVIMLMLLCRPFVLVVGF